MHDEIPVGSSNQKYGPQLHESENSVVNFPAGSLLHIDCEAQNLGIFDITTPTTPPRSAFTIMHCSISVMRCMQ